MILKTDEIKAEIPYTAGQKHKRNTLIILTVGMVLLLFSMCLSITIGAADISVSVVLDALVHFDSSNKAHNIIWELRLPRTIGAMIVGASFAVAGAMMQGMTRNILAEPGLLGLNAGGVFALALCLAFAPHFSYLTIVCIAFLGAGLGATLVFGIGSMSAGGLTPIRLVLAGAAVTALLIALSEGVALYYEIGQDLAFWFAGGVSATTWEQLEVIAPFVIIAMIASIMLSRSITLLSLGEEVALGLGQKTKRIKFLATVVILMLAGTSVTVVGAVGFIGLIVPHMTRALVGVDYRYIIPCSAVLGGLLVVYADIAARSVNPPYETPLGALIAVLGVPFFLYLAQKEKGAL
ncbi:FecCD family ABC transporter permease [Priestia taiwanensis]|uniref:Ferrichrome ABC transporter permease n=1 Tax=Priestia taiwanensis TaxID=1347902 RepID=A0A917ENW1_9BACI|nr:iron ABC transporter permease [Priestia taiwanensis]MBM7363221.1 iron complex transport system permease protein [Priestia taiwanensis]GGE68648.1 ferrichrome ABC transporter permease [Priestia taiwanensis]